ncbi:MAG TPA: leucyl aminopeptidase family protein [Beijerinckiaceae bacterium]|nr:leucyl aminopeptidase family protein [Beijerinckiaceae bacterium]
MPEPILIARRPAASRPIHFAHAGNWAEVAATLSDCARRYLEATGFKASAGKIAIAPGADGEIEAVLLGIEGPESPTRDLFAAGRLPGALPAGTYHFASAPERSDLAALAFAMACYRFAAYKKNEPPKVQLVTPKGVDGGRIERIAAAVAMGRDLINTPAQDMQPTALAAAAKALAQKHEVKAKEIVGDTLLKQNFPMIHAVGRAAAEAPRLIDFSWGNPKHPKVTLVGKGVCFDTGGLNIKPDAAMLLMKKDMGGAATALTAARLVMDAKLAVRLRVLLPIVENAVSAASFRPGDILKSRKGLTVEIGNTDAEGRLVLADALTLADEDKPDLVLDFATLTGAARVALGPDLPPFYSDDNALATEIEAAGQAVNDPVWRLPLWRGYDSMLDSKIADMNNTATGGFAGSITAALFLRRFIDARSWAHFDVYAWSPSAKSGLPEGGNPQVARLVLELLERRYGR